MQDFAQSQSKILECMRTMIKDCDNALVDKLFSTLIHGKMLRSKLVLAICKESKQALELCAIIELIQSASLLHDDVIDNAPTRRNSPSFHTNFGNKNAILLGDILYARAFFELTKLPLQIAQSLSDSVVKLSIGEAEDVFMSESFNANKERYLKMCENKTASLIAASSESAAILSGLDSYKYKIYGKNLGIAFQIIDDILDVTQDAATLGKPAMSDLSEGKSTLPFILFFSHATQAEQERFLGLFAKKLDIQDQVWLKECLVRYACITESIDLAKSYAKISLETIKNECNPELSAIVESMIEREF